jgi:CPA2 family monovalent cation:H+ antiporter-2
MDGHGTDLSGIVAVILVALICGEAMTRLRQPAIVGYILAGVVLGPSALGAVQDRHSINVLAELGVLMLLFVVGTELRVRALRELWRPVVIATALQIAGALAIMLVLMPLLGWSLGFAVLLAFAVALSSTAVAIKMIAETGQQQTRSGRLAVAILIAQDLAVVPMAMVIGTIGGGELETLGLVRIAFAVVLLAALIVYLARHDEISLPYAGSMRRSSDLVPVAGLAYCFGGAAAAGLLGLSPAYGAFLAGMLVGNSSISDTVHAGVRPIQTVLLMAFFVSIGLLLDFGYILDNLWTVLLLVLLVTLFKTVLNIAFIRFAGQTWAVAMVSGLLLAQIGEFSFVLAGVAAGHGLLSGEERNLVVSLTVLSLAFSPAWLTLTRRLIQIMRPAEEPLDELLERLFQEGPQDTFAVRTLRAGRNSTRRTGLALRRAGALALYAFIPRRISGKPRGSAENDAEDTDSA